MPTRIGRRVVGPDAPLFVIAEIGLNHGGSVEEALALVDLAAEAGASAVKLQTLRGETLVAPHCPPPMHVEAQSLVDFFAGFELDEEAHRRIAARARAHGLAMLSTPFDLDAVALLERVGVDAYKIASGDVTYHQLIARAAATGKPLIISTGMSDLADVGEALACARAAGATDVALLHCVSAYPVPAGSENLRAIATLAQTFQVPVGLSDHSACPEAAVVTMALGGSLYERHIVADAASTAIDKDVSSTAQELAGIVAMAERARYALGDGIKRCLQSESPNREGSRRGLYAARNLAPGHSISEDDFTALRPLGPIDARDWRSVIGRTVTRAVTAGEALDPTMFVASAGQAIEVQRAV